LSLRPVPITLPPSNPSWRFAPSPAFLAAALAPLSVTLAHPFVSTVPAILPPPARPPSPPPPPRICVSSCWVEPTPRELTSCAKRTPVRSLRLRAPFGFCAPLARHLPALASVDVRTRSAREYGGCWEGGYASLAAASPPSVAFLPAPARAPSSSSHCGSSTALSPRGLCYAVSLSPHVWPDLLRSIWGLGAEVACLPVSGRDA
ncbi:hypothetical protein DFH09DRAFT_1174801, partial [Mycena vulgaris]